MSASSERRTRTRQIVRDFILTLNPGEEVFANDVSRATGVPVFRVGKYLIDMEDILERVADIKKKGGRFRYRRR